MSSSNNFSIFRAKTDPNLSHTISSSELNISVKCLPITLTLNQISYTTVVLYDRKTAETCARQNTTLCTEAYTSTDLIL